MIDFYKPNLGTLMPLPGSGKSLRIQLTACFPLLVLMSIYFFSFDVAHPLGDSATHPIEPLATRLGALLLLAGRSCASSSPLRGAAMPEAWPAQAVQTCAGRFGAAAFALPRRAASGPLGRVQLRN